MKIIILRVNKSLALKPFKLHNRPLFPCLATHNQVDSMKKITCIIFAALLLSACSPSKEQVGLKEVLVAKLQDDTDLKDYKLDPSDVADCVVKAISENAPGIPGDPRRTRYFEAFTKFIDVKAPGDAQKATEDYKDLFGGSVSQAREAAMSVTEYIMSCMGMGIDARGDGEEKPKAEKTQ